MEECKAIYYLLFALVHRMDNSSAGSITKFQWFWLNMEFSGSGAEEGRECLGYMI